MTMSKAHRLIVAVAALATAFSARASFGEGFKVGEKGLLRPYLDIEERYDSAAMYTARGSAEGDFITHFRPGLTLEVPTGNAVVSLSGNLDWAQYASATELSRLYGGASVNVGVNRRGAVGLEFSDEFRRSDRTSTLTLPYAAISTYNALQLAVPWRPGGGAITFSAGGQWITESFQPFQRGVICTGPAELCDTGNAPKLSYNELRGNGQIRWRFLPRTAGIFDLAYVSRLPSDRSISPAVGRLEVQTGVTGLITPTLAATIKGGYGDTLSSAGKPFGTPLADLEAEWLPMPGVSGRIGYLHSLGSDPGSLFGLYRSHRLFVESRAALGGRYTLSLTGSYDRLESDAMKLNSGLGVVEPRIDADLTRWLRLGAGYAFSYRCTSGVKRCLDQMFGYSGQTLATLPGSPYLNYKKHEVYLRADVIY